MQSIPTRRRNVPMKRCMYCIHTHTDTQAHMYAPPFTAAQHRAAPSSVPPMSQECGNDCLNFIKRTASFGSIFTNTIKKKQL